MPKSLPLLVRIAKELLEFQESLNGEDGDMGRQTNGTPHAPGRKEFTALEKSIFEASTDEWQTKAELADRCGQTVSSWFAYALASLAERGYLESGRQGYRRPPL